MYLCFYHETICVNIVWYFFFVIWYNFLSLFSSSFLFQFSCKVIFSHRCLSVFVRFNNTFVCNAQIDTSFFFYVYVFTFHNSTVRDTFVAMFLNVLKYIQVYIFQPFVRFNKYIRMQCSLNIYTNI